MDDVERGLADYLTGRLAEGMERLVDGADPLAREVPPRCPNPYPHDPHEWVATLMTVPPEQVGTHPCPGVPAIQPVHKIPAVVPFSHELWMDSGRHECTPACPYWSPPPPPLTARQLRTAKWRARRRRAWWTVRHLHEFRFVHRSELEHEEEWEK